MIWLKRIAPFLLIALLYFGYTYFQENKAAKFETQEERYADIIARLWVGSVSYRDSIELYTAFRDSLLTANQLDSTEVFKTLRMYEEHPEMIASLSQQIKVKADSLINQQMVKLDSIQSDTISSK